MTLLSTEQTLGTSPPNPMIPRWAEIVDIEEEAPEVKTFWLRFTDPEVRERYSFRAGQFNKLTVPGYGEAAISISSSVKDTQAIGHTIRTVGNVTHAIDRVERGGIVGVRGPYGSHWPIEDMKGKNVYIAAGGIGLPPLRPVIYHIMENREDYGEVVILYGARTPKDLQFQDEYDRWRESDIEVMVTVDQADEDWTGQVGVVPMLFYRVRMDPKNSIALTCGPEIMIHFVVYEAIARRIPQDRIFVSLEKNMACGFGSCGHCQLGPYFVCKDGPVFSYEQIGPYLEVEDF